MLPTITCGWITFSFISVSTFLEIAPKTTDKRIVLLLTVGCANIFEITEVMQCSNHVAAHLFVQIFKQLKSYKLTRFNETALCYDAVVLFFRLRQSH